MDFRKLLKSNPQIIFNLNRNMTFLKTKVKILIIDDENFETKDILVERKYNIYYKNDIYNEIEAEPFDIIIMDIMGVATHRKSNMEGLSMAKEIKKNYPNKLVFCYSGSSSPELMSEISQIDGFIIKDLDIDKWADKLDDAIIKYTSIDWQWEVLKSKLENSGNDSKTISKFKNNYFKSFHTSNFDLLIDDIKLVAKNAKEYLVILELIYGFISIFIE